MDYPINLSRDKNTDYSVKYYFGRYAEIWLR